MLTPDAKVKCLLFLFPFPVHFSFALSLVACLVENVGVGMEPDNCVVAIFTDTACSTSKQFANVTAVGTCYALGGPIKSISVTC